MLRSAANRRRQNCKTARTWNASLKAISSRYVSWTIQSAAVGWCDQQRVGVGRTVGPALVRDVGLDVLDGVDGLELES